VSGRLLPSKISIISTSPETLAMAAPTALATSWNLGSLYKKMTLNENNNVSEVEYLHDVSYAP
jgi:hypothetical protein